MEKIDLKAKIAEIRKHPKDQQLRLMQELRDTLEYSKDMKVAQEKRDRWNTIYQSATFDGATDQELIKERIGKMKLLLYTEEELTESKSASSNEWGYDPFYKKYWNDERNKNFFDKLVINEDGIIIDGKKFTFLTAKPNNETILMGGSEVKWSRGGMLWATYMTGEAAKIEAEKQWKKLFKNTTEVAAFIEQFPGETLAEKVDAFVMLFDLKQAGYYNASANERTWKDEVGYVTLSGVQENWTVVKLYWNEYISGITSVAEGNPTLTMAFEGVK